MVATSGLPIYVMGNEDLYHSFVMHGGEWKDDAGIEVASFETGIGCGSDKVYVTLLRPGVPSGSLKVYVKARDLFQFVLDNEEGLVKAADELTVVRRAEREAAKAEKAASG